ncbi:hypothetical protein [Mesoplasma florum]|uniref:hypothetical protein n=1 Tax=Mesoplasma florum TaxID=2151 RepID=UPI0018F87755|nr:hypothetical protein [Mesoplasma florum]
MKKLLALLGVAALTANVVIASVAIANADKKKQNDIRILQSKLEAILKSKTDAKWEVSELQTKVETEFGKGEITVSGGTYSDDNNYTGQTKKKAEFTFKGNATTDTQNTLKYKGEITLTHTYTKQTVPDDLNGVITVKDLGTLTGDDETM